MGRIGILAYGIVAYLTFFVTFLYAIGFVGGHWVPKAIDDGAVGSPLVATLVNITLLGAFAIQHVIMARPRFKDWVTRYIPRAIERSTFVLAASGILLATFALWRPMPDVVWDIQHPALRMGVWAIHFLGFGIVLYSSFLIDHFDLFGLRQVALHFRNAPYTDKPFMARSLYRLVRHPLMLGFLLAFWAAPTMSLGHLLFALVTTAYIHFGTMIEERDLVGQHGQAYVDYRRRTNAFIPLPKIGAAAPAMQPKV
jgi:protein-S-isoprenylcysteine O-methyltransferase Ste14